MKFFCDQCKKAFSYDDNAEGKISCPDCQSQFDNPGPKNLAPGVILGDFLIKGNISSGGMGQVFLAQQLSLDRDVALKVLHNKYTGDKEYIDSLFSEAKAAAKLSHPNIVQAYAVGEADGIFYFAMEYVRGNTFKEILKKQNKIPFDQAVKVIIEIAGAINIAWKEQKLVHQDIKPDNIMLDANGFAKLADLGLAKTATSQKNAQEDADEVLGTPQYISPEQLTGVQTDVRSDIYSLGATFYHFVTGRFAYEAPLAEDIARQHVEGNLIPPKEKNPELPEELNAIIVKMMARYPEDRYQTPEPLIKDLEKYKYSATRSMPKITLSGLKRPGTGDGVGGIRLPQAKPAVPQAKPAVPQAKPAVPQAKPAAPQAKPAVPQAKPAVPQAKPAIPQAKPAIPQAKPATPQAKPAIPQAKPVAEAKSEKTADAVIPSGENAKNSDTPAKKSTGKKAVKWVFISIGILLLLVLAFAITLYVLEVKEKTPAFLKPVSSRLRGSVKSAVSDAKNKALELSKPTMTYAKIDSTAPDITDESLRTINDILNWRLSNPSDDSGFLTKIDAQWNFLLKVTSPEAFNKLSTLCNSFAGPDEVRIAAARQAMRADHEKRLAEITAKHEAEQRRMEKEKQQREAQKLEAEKRAKELEEQRKKDAENQKRHEAELAQVIMGLKKTHANAMLKAIYENDETDLKQSAADILTYCKSAIVFSPAETAMVAALRKFVGESAAELKAIRRFETMVGRINPAHSLIVYPSRNVRATVVSIRPGEIKCRDNSDENIIFKLDFSECDDSVKQRLCATMERRFKLKFVGFYLSLMQRCVDKFATRQLPPYWKANWAVFKDLF